MISVIDTSYSRASKQTSKWSNDIQFEIPLLFYVYIYVFSIYSRIFKIISELRVLYNAQIDDEEYEWIGIIRSNNDQKVTHTYKIPQTSMNSEHTEGREKKQLRKQSKCMKRSELVLVEPTIRFSEILFGYVYVYECALCTFL